VPKIQEVGTEVEAEYRKLAPPIWEDLPAFSQLCRQPPSGVWKKLLVFHNSVVDLFFSDPDSDPIFVRVLDPDPDPDPF
jgi:hypothetical protein